MSLQDIIVDHFQEHIESWVKMFLDKPPSSEMQSEDWQEFLRRIKLWSNNLLDLPDLNRKLIASLPSDQLDEMLKSTNAKLVLIRKEIERRN